MSKGIIAVDIPENCRDCKYFGFVCKITGERCNRYNQDKRPVWCPIRSIPEKKDIIGNLKDQEESKRDLVRAGWNMCIDELLKEGR